MFNTYIQQISSQNMSIVLIQTLFEIDCLRKHIEGLVLFVAFHQLGRFVAVVRSGWNNSVHWFNKKISPFSKVARNLEVNQILLVPLHLVRSSWTCSLVAVGGAFFLNNSSLTVPSGFICNKDITYSLLISTRF